MNCFQQSLIFSTIASLWYKLLDVYPQSFLSVIVGGVVRLYRGSFLCRLFSYDSRLEKLWRDSLFFKALNWLMNLVPLLLGKLRNRWESKFDESLFCRLLCFLGRNTICFVGVYLTFILIVPYERWNNMYSLILSACCLLLFYLNGLSRQGKRLELEAIGPWPTLFALVTCLSLVWSQDASISLRFLFFTITCVFTVMVLVSGVSNERQLLRVVELLTLGLLVCSAYGVYQRITGIEASASFTDLDLNSDMPGRVYSFFKNPNAFANLLVFFTPLTAAMIFYAPNWREKVFFLLVTGLCALALVLTFSRGGWLSLVFAFFILALMLCPRWVPLFIVLAFLALPLLPDSIKSRLLSMFRGDSSISSRNYIYSAMVRLLENNWFYGVGLGTSALKRGIAYYGVYNAHFPFVHAHNIILEIWGESGIIAVFSFVASMFFSFRKGCDAFKRSTSPLLRAILAGCVSGLAGSMLFGLTDYAWTFPRIMVLFWFLFAILYAAVKLSRCDDRLTKEVNING